MSLIGEFNDTMIFTESLALDKPTENCSRFGFPDRQDSYRRNLVTSSLACRSHSTGNSFTRREIDAKEELAKSAILKVTVLNSQIEIQLKFLVLLEWRPERGSPDTAQSDLPSGQRKDVFTLSCPFSQARRGQELRLIIDGAEPALATRTYALLKGIAGARTWFEQIVAGELGSIPELAKREGVTPRYVRRIMPCAMLGPQGVEAILGGKCSPDLTLDSVCARSNRGIKGRRALHNTEPQCRA